MLALPGTTSIPALAVLMVGIGLGWASMMGNNYELLARSILGRLDRITARYSGKPTNWRLLATANGIEDPLTLRPGSVITVPRMEST